MNAVRAANSMRSTLPSLSGAVVAVMGAGSGIGKGVVTRLTGMGANLSLADMNGEAVRVQADAVRAGGGKCMAFEVDVRDTDAVNRWINESVKALGKLDGAVNSAGVCVSNPLRGSGLPSLKADVGLSQEARGCRTNHDEVR